MISPCVRDNLSEFEKAIGKRIIYSKKDSNIAVFNEKQLKDLIDSWGRKLNEFSDPEEIALASQRILLLKSRLNDIVCAKAQQKSEYLKLIRSAVDRTKAKYYSEGLDFMRVKVCKILDKIKITDEGSEWYIEDDIDNIKKHKGMDSLLQGFKSVVYLLF